MNRSLASNESSIKNGNDCLDSMGREEQPLSGKNPLETNETVTRLASFKPVEYDQVREEEAKKLNIRVGTLDKEVESARKIIDKQESTDSIISNIEPWPDRVNAESVFEEVSQIFTKYLVLPDGAVDILTLWAAHTHVYSAFQHTPRLNITSPERECGKTLTLDVLETVTPKALRTQNVTTAVLFRIVDKESPTLS